MTYDAKKVTCSIHHPNPLTNDLIHLGSKGYNLVVLASEGIPGSSRLYRHHGGLPLSADHREV